MIARPTLYLTTTDTTCKPFILLKDTGASRSVLLANVLHFSDKSYSDKSVLLQDVEFGVVIVPLYPVFLTPDLVSGPTTLGFVLVFKLKNGVCIYNLSFGKGLEGLLVAIMDHGDVLSPLLSERDLTIEMVKIVVVK